MKQFEFSVPTRIIFGRGKINIIRDVIPHTIKRLIIVTDKHSGIKSGALDAICSRLTGLDYDIFDGVEENPSIGLIDEMQDLMIKNRYQLVLAVGGGSPMDAAKGIAVVATNEGTIWEYMDGRELENKPLPVICVPTTSGTGSEVTPYAVFSDHEKGFKGGFSNSGIYPIVSVIDPELTFSMPEDLAINTGLDVLTHAIESYLSSESSGITDTLALHSIETVIYNLRKAGEKDEDAMCEMAYASMIAGLTIAHAGTILLHIMAYPLTVYNKVHHGKANAILLPQFLKFMSQNATNKDKVNTIVSLFEPFGGVRAFVEELGVSTRLKDYGVSESQLKLFAEKTIVKGDIKITPAALTEEIIVNIYKETM